jgi:adenylylsulfate kinase
MDLKEGSVKWHRSIISRSDRFIQNNHKSCVVWFTGLSGSGKSTLAMEIDKELFSLSIRSYVLDGDNMRQGLNKDLGFSLMERNENNRRVAEVASLFIDAGLIALVSLISPYEKDRDYVRRLFSCDEFIEVYVTCSLKECERRDPKGLYKKARTGLIQSFTGISAPYEIPSNPEIIIDTEKQSLRESTDQIIQYLREKKIIWF